MGRVPSSSLCLGLGSTSMKMQRNYTGILLTVAGNSFFIVISSKGRNLACEG